MPHNTPEHSCLFYNRHFLVPSRYNTNIYFPINLKRNVVHTGFNMHINKFIINIIIASLCFLHIKFLHLKPSHGICMGSNSLSLVQRKKHDKE